MTEKVRNMNSTFDIETISALTRSLERSEARRLGVGVTKTRASIARRLGVSAQTFENYIYGRMKSVPHWLMSRVRSELITVLQREISHLEHEIQIHRQAGDHHSGNSIVAAETALAKARALLAGE